MELSKGQKLPSDVPMDTVGERMDREEALALLESAEVDVPDLDTWKKWEGYVISRGGTLALVKIAGQTYQKVRITPY